PAVCDVQARPDDAAERRARAAGLLQAREQRSLLLGPLGLWPDLVVPDAGVDDDAQALGLDQECVDAHPEPSGLVAERRIEPVPLALDVLSRRIRQQDGPVPRAFRLEDASDADVPYPPR